MPKILGSMTTFVILLGLVIVLAWLRQCGQEAVSGSAAVIDGDSLRVEGLEIRLKGLDAPELHQTCFKDGGPYACGEVARGALIRLIAGRPVTCRIEGRDRYGRSLGRCAVGGDDVGHALVVQGLAVAYGDYRSEEDEARRNRLGLWAGRFDPPAEWRKSHPNPRRPSP